VFLKVTAVLVRKHLCIRSEAVSKAEYSCCAADGEKRYRMVSSIQKVIAETPLLVALIVFCAGALSSLSSSTIVRVPVALGFIAGATESKKNALLVTVLFVSGLIVAYTVLGMFLGVVGRFAFTIVQVNKYVLYLIGLLLLVFGLFISGLFKLKRLPRIFRFHESFRHVTLIGAFAFGTLFAWLEMPTSPVCGGILLMLSSLVVTHDLAHYAILIFVSFALGQSLPVLAVALSTSLIKTDIIMFLISKIQQIEDHINFVAGNILMTLGVYYLVIA
jgi:cytochrome c-type biogenesis protein